MPWIAKEKNKKKGDKDKDKKKRSWFNCGIMGHYQSECRKPKRRERVKKLWEDSEIEEDDLKELVGQIQDEVRQEDLWESGPRVWSQRRPRQ